MNNSDTRWVAIVIVCLGFAWAGTISFVSIFGNNPAKINAITRLEAISNGYAKYEEKDGKRVFIWKTKKQICNENTSQ